VSSGKSRSVLVDQRARQRHLVAQRLPLALAMREKRWMAKRRPRGSAAASVATPICSGLEKPPIESGARSSTLPRHRRRSFAMTAMKPRQWFHWSCDSRQRIGLMHHLCV